MDDVLEITKPAPDSQYRLRACPFCGDIDNAAYLKYEAAAGDMWRVRCFSCGSEVAPGNAYTRHTAQLAWNRLTDNKIELPAVAG